MFECSKCGECCRNLDKSELYTDLNRGDGVCRYLAGNECSIYENLPILCRIDEGYEVFFREKLSIEEYYRLNYEACEKLKDGRFV